MRDANKGRVPRREYCVWHGRSRGHAGNGISHLQNIPRACPFCTGSGTRVVRVSLAKRRSGGNSSALIVGHSHRVSDTAPVEGCSDPPMEECAVNRNTNQGRGE